MLGTDSAKLKAVLLTQDGGRTWLVVRQYYLTDLATTEFLDESVQGFKLKTIEGHNHGRTGTENNKA